MSSPTKTVRYVAICREWRTDDPYQVQVDDPSIPVFEVPERYVVRIHDELSEGCSWSAEIELFDGLIEYLKAYAIFEYVEDENGFHHGELIVDRLRQRLAIGPCWTH